MDTRPNPEPNFTSSTTAVATKTGVAVTLATKTLLAVGMLSAIGGFAAAVAPSEVQPMPRLLPQLRVAVAAMPTDTAIVKGTINHTAVAFNFFANTDTSVTLTSINLTAGTSNMNDNTYAHDGDGVRVSDLVLSVKLMDGNTQVGPSRVFSSGTATFENLNWVIPSMKTKKLDVVVTTNSAATLAGGNDDYFRVSLEAGSMKASRGSGIATSIVGLPANSAEAVSDVVVTIRPQGSLTAYVAPTPINPPSGLHTAGSIDKVLAAFKFEATIEPFYVKKLTLTPYVSGVASTASNDRVAALKVRYPTNNGTITQTVGLSGTYNLVDISVQPMYVPQDGSANLEVLVDWANFALLNGTEAENITFSLDADNSQAQNQADGVASNTQDNVWGSDVAGNRQNVYRTVLAAAPGSGTPNGTSRTRAAAQKVMSLNLTASASANALIRATDAITVHVAGNIHPSANGLVFNLKDLGGTVRATGTFDLANGRVVLTPVGDIEIASTILALDLETNTVTLVADAPNVPDPLSVWVDTGTVSAAGDIKWYDNSDSAGGNNMPGITVVNPTSTNISFNNTY